MRFERGGNIKKTLNIGVRSLLKSHRICLIEESDFIPGCIPKDVDVWSDQFLLNTDNLLDFDEMLQRAGNSIVKILHFRGYFQIHGIKINERSYTEAWAENYKYPDHMLESCLEFFIRKSQEIKFASSKRIS